MKRLMITATLLSGFAMQAANTWFVDDDNYGKTGLDGKTEATAFGTIQDALDNDALTAGDTVKVLPGTYDKGGYATTTSVTTNRVTLTKYVILQSTEGAGKTFIVGHWMTAAEGGDSHGRGTAAVRCINEDVETKSQIKGFTLCNGSTGSAASDTAPNRGGGFNGTGRATLLVDCVISNCTAYKGAAIRSGTGVRCFITDCWAPNSGTAANGSGLYASIVTRCSGANLMSTVTACNCTFVGNEVNPYACYLYNCLMYSSSGDKGYANNSCYTNGGLYQLMGPAVGDFRLIKGSHAETAGSGSYATWVGNIGGSGLRYFDFYGNPIPETGVIPAGAVMETAEPAAGGMMIAGKNITIDGKLAKIGEWWFPDAYPTQYVTKIVTDEGEYAWSVSRSGSGVGHHFPAMNDEFLLMPPADVTMVSTNNYRSATKAFWVNPNPEIGSDSNAGTKTAPFLNLQKAIDSVTESVRTVIFAEEGDYTNGWFSVADKTDASVLSFVTNVVTFPNNNYFVRVVGKGAGKSFISGRPDPDTKGFGPRAIRPVGSYSLYSAIQGFTLRNGWTDSSSAKSVELASAYTGRDIYGGQLSGLLDCVITGCHSTESLVRYARVTRCIFTNNVSSACVVNLSHVSNSMFDDNTTGAGRSSMGLSGYYAVNCTSRTMPGSWPIGANSTVYGCVFEDGLEMATATYAGCVVHNVTRTSALTEGNTIANPCFNGLATGDYRLRTYSPALTSMVKPTVSNYGKWYWRFVDFDLNGNRPVFVDGHPVAGAYQQAVPTPDVLEVQAADGGLSLPNGDNKFVGESFMITTQAGGRPCYGFIYDGVTNLFNDSASKTITAAEVAAKNGAMVEALYGNDWYVNANVGDDANTGYCETQPKKTLKGAMEVARLQNGDTVHAAAGTYDEGVMYRDPAVQMGSRVRVPNGVTLEGEGADKTFIVGADATTEDANEYGCGSNAVRCVTLYTNSVVRGFTLTGGRTTVHEGGKDHPDNDGSCVAAENMAQSSTHIVEDCILTNGVAYRGAAVYCTLRRCRVVGNRQMNSGSTGGSYRCCNYSSYINHNYGYNQVMYADTLDQCTVGCDGSTYALQQSGGFPILNSILIGPINFGKASMTATNTYFTATPSNLKSADWPWQGAGTYIVSEDDLQFTEFGRPIPGANVAIGMANPEYLKVSKHGTTDAAGTQRIYNGALDCGAYAADWLTRYGEDLGATSRRFSVIGATENVVESNTRSVQVPDGETLLLGGETSGASTYQYEMTLVVPEGATAVVNVNGETQNYATAGTHTIKWSNALAANVASVSAVDGTVEVLSSRGWSGLKIMIR